MRPEFGFAWSKLYMAVVEMATNSAPPPERVTQAFRRHLGSLNSQNMPAEGYERLKFIRGKLSGFSEQADEDVTLDLAPLSKAEAMAVAEEIVSLYDEIAKADARDRL